MHVGKHSSALGWSSATPAVAQDRHSRVQAHPALCFLPGAIPPPATEAARGMSSLSSKKRRTATTSTPLRLESAWNSGCAASSGELRTNACTGVPVCHQTERTNQIVSLRHASQEQARRRTDARVRAIIVLIVVRYARRGSWVDAINP